MVSHGIVPYCIKLYGRYCFDMSSKKPQIYQQNLSVLTEIKYTNLTKHSGVNNGIKQIAKEKAFQFTSVVQKNLKSFSADSFFPSHSVCRRYFYQEGNAPPVKK